MNKQALVLFVLIAGLIALGFEAHAKAPREIPYQGFLESNGQPAEGDHDFRFTLWGDNNNLWTDTLTLYVATGKFSVVLGAATPIPEHAFSVQTLEVAIEVRKTGSGDAFKALGGRQRISSTAFSVRSRETDALPPGVIMAYYGSTAPEGWLIANGATIDKSTNPQYAALVDFLRGCTSNCTINTVQLPDLGRRFLRGYGTGTGSVGTAKSDSIAPHGHSASSVTANHTHPTSTVTDRGNHSHTLVGARYINISNDSGSWGVYYVENDGNGSAKTINTNSTGTHDHSISSSGGHTHTINVQNTGSGIGTETAPDHVVINWIIKY